MGASVLSCDCAILCLQRFPGDVRVRVSPSPLLMKEHFHALIHRLADRLGIRVHRHVPTAPESVHGVGVAANRWRRFLWRIRHSSFFPFVVGLLAAISAATGVYPFGPVLATAILVAPRRWWSIYGASCLGALVGVLTLAILVQSYGFPWVEALFPGIEQSADWQRCTYWWSRYGWLALAVFAASPLPQMPILVLSALSQMGLAKIAAAILVAKLIKYGVYGAAVLAVLRVLRERDGRQARMPE